MPSDDEDGEGEGARGKRLVNGVGKRPRIRGGGEECVKNEELLKEATKLQYWSRWTTYRSVDGEGRYEVLSSHPVYNREVRGGDRLDECMKKPTAQIPCLRGGGKSDRGPIRVPSSLLYLAGSTGRKVGDSVTIAEWNRMKPKKRMGGLLGMAVYGNKAGQPYIPRIRNQGAQADSDVVAG